MHFTGTLDCEIFGMFLRGVSALLKCFTQQIGGSRIANNAQRLAALNESAVKGLTRNNGNYPA
jgi:hypothetical protein